jgi:zinc transporter 2
MSSYQNSSSSASSSSKAVVTAACDSHDDHHTTHGRAHNEPRDVNMEAAYLHVLTDLMQSAGVALAGLVIWWRPAYQIIDPICTLLFSTVALSATVPLLKRIFLVFFEGTPSHVAFEGVHERFMAIPGVTDVHDLHIWSISAKSVSLTCHMCAVDPQAALLAAQEQCRKLGIDHVTIQITSEGCASAHCSDDSGVGCYKH